VAFNSLLKEDLLAASQLVRIAVAPRRKGGTPEPYAGTSTYVDELCGVGTSMPSLLRPSR
jgi:hypothetical protein